MGLSSYLASAALFATTALAQSAQVVSYAANNNYGISVNVPANTASSGSGSIFLQISAPSGTQWVGFGQGRSMSGANMLVVYAQDSSNVTVSPRLGTGHVMPQFNSAAQVTLLAGSGIKADGSLVANIRCDSCLSWSGGSMSPTSSSSNWIWAYKTGSALDSDDQSAQISQHNSDGTFSLDLTKGTGGNSNNPFVAAASDSGSSSASASASSSASTSSSPMRTGTAASASSTTSSTLARSSTAAASGTNSVSEPVATSNPNSGSSSSTSGTTESSTSDNTNTLILAHGTIMSILFVALFPLASLTLYLPTAIKVRFIHAPLQMLGTLLLIIGMALGVVLAQRLSQIGSGHAIFGLIIVVVMVLFQPAMGVYQHLHYSKTGGRSIFGQIHRWLGRTLLILGVINGGLGFQLSGNTGALPYAVVAAIIFLVYIAVLLWAWRSSGTTSDVAAEKAAAGRGFEMQKPRKIGHARLTSNETGASAYGQQKSNAYTIQNNRF